MRRRTRHTTPVRFRSVSGLARTLARNRSPLNCGILHKNTILNCGILHKNADLNCGILHNRRPKHYSYKKNRHTIATCKENKDATA